MSVVLAVRNGQTQLVDVGGPGQPFACARIQVPFGGDGVEQFHRHGLNPFCLGLVHAIALRQAANACGAWVVARRASEHFPQQALAHRPVADAEPLQIERVEHGLDDGDAARDDRSTFLAHARQRDAAHRPGLQQRIAHALERCTGDGIGFAAHRAGDRRDRAHGAGCAPRLAPAFFAIFSGELLDHHAHFFLRALPALGRDATVGKETQARGDASDLHAFGELGIKAAPHDEFGAAAADVDDQPAFARTRQRVHHALPDQARFLAATDHFDGMAERAFGLAQEGQWCTQFPDGVGGHRAHPLGRHGCKALAETREALQGRIAARRIEAAVGLESRRHPDVFAQMVDWSGFAVFTTRDQQVETVGAEIDRREQVAVADACVAAVRHIALPGGPPRL